MPVLSWLAKRCAGIVLSSRESILFRLPGRKINVIFDIEWMVEEEERKRARS
jgi:hypothetical protein